MPTFLDKNVILAGLKCKEIFAEKKDQVQANILLSKLSLTQIIHYRIIF